MLVPKHSWPCDLAPVPDAVRCDGVYVLRKTYSDGSVWVHGLRFWKDGHVFEFHYLPAVVDGHDPQIWERLDGSSGEPGICRWEKPFLLIYTVQVTGVMFDNFDFHDTRTVVNTDNITIISSKRHKKWFWDTYDTGDQYRFMHVDGLHAPASW